MAEGKSVLIKVISTNFTHINKNYINGTAIHIDNCGLECNRTLFVDCVISEGCGGAIYIRNTFDISNNITFEDLTFIKCKAICGGAVFIHSDREENEVLIRNCTFVSNEAFHKKFSNSISLYGGSAIYLSSHDANVIDCSFKQNIGKGGCVKIESINNKNKRILQLEIEPNPIKISGCSFENVKKSESSIVFEDDISEIEIKECNFKGKLKKGFHYIDGKTINKDKLRIKDCLFEYDTNSSINTKLIKQLNNHESKNSVHNRTKVAIFIFSFLSILVVMIIKVVESYDKNIDKQFDSEDFSDQLSDNLL